MHGTKSHFVTGRCSEALQMKPLLSHGRKFLECAPSLSWRACRQSNNALSICADAGQLSQAGGGGLPGGVFSRPLATITPETPTPADWCSIRCCYHTDIKTIGMLTQTRCRQAQHNHNHCCFTNPLPGAWMWGRPGCRGKTLLPAQAHLQHTHAGMA